MKIIILLLFISASLYSQGHDPVVLDWYNYDTLSADKTDLLLKDNCAIGADEWHVFDYYTVVSTRESIMLSGSIHVQHTFKRININGIVQRKDSIVTIRIFTDPFNLDL